MRILKEMLARQFRRPSGLIGRYLSRKMAVLNAEPYSWIVEMMDIRESDRVLEIGFGPGIGVELLAKITARGSGSVCGVDFSETMVKVATGRNRSMIARGEVDLRFGDATSLNYEDNTFDKVLAVNCLYFWPQFERCLGEIERLLSPGGRVGFYITDRNSLDARALTQSELFINRFDGQELADVLATAGFEETKAHTREIRSGGRLRTGHVVLGFSKQRLDLNI